MLHIETIVVTPFQQNARVIQDLSNRKGIIVDPGGDTEKILAKIQNIEIEAIWLTHSHIDHIGGLKKLVKELNQNEVAIYGSEKEKWMRDNLVIQAQMLGVPSHDLSNLPAITHCWEQANSSISALGHEWNILFTPGHSPGHYSFFTESCPYSDETGENKSPILIAGDALFRESIGRTDLPGGDHAQLLESITTQMWPLPEETLVLPGHGPNTTIEHEKKWNPFLRP